MEKICPDRELCQTSIITTALPSITRFHQESPNSSTLNTVGRNLSSSSARNSLGSPFCGSSSIGMWINSSGNLSACFVWNGSNGHRDQTSGELVEVFVNKSASSEICRASERNLFASFPSGQFFHYSKPFEEGKSRCILSSIGFRPNCCQLNALDDGSDRLDQHQTIRLQHSKPTVARPP